MTLEEQILHLESQREKCLDELDDEIHAGMRHLRQHLSVARFIRRHLGPSMVTAGIAGILLPWLAGKAKPLSRTGNRADEGGSDVHECVGTSASKGDTQAPSRGSASRLLSAVVRTAAIEVASRVDVPGLISRFLKKPEKPKNPDANDG